MTPETKLTESFDPHKYHRLQSRDDYLELDLDSLNLGWAIGDDREEQVRWTAYRYIEIVQSGDLDLEIDLCLMDRHTSVPEALHIKVAHSLVSAGRLKLTKDKDGVIRFVRTGRDSHDLDTPDLGKAKKLSN